MNCKERNERKDSAASRGAIGRLVVSATCVVLLVSVSFRASSSPPAPRTLEQTHRQTKVLGTGFQSQLRPLPGLRLMPSLFPSTAETESRPAIEEDTEGRGDWFMFQRTYGSDAIPADARSRAWKSHTEFQTTGRFRTEAAAAWRSIGPNPTVPAWESWGSTSGRVNSIAVSPGDSQVVLLGTSTGGIWRSTDGGASFIPVSDDQADLEVGYLAFSKSNPSIAYAGMGDTKLGYLGSGVLKTTDEGATWTRVSNNTLPAPGSISRLEVDPTNSNRVYVAQYAVASGAKVKAGGLYLSTDGGINWNKVLAGAARDVILDPANPRNIYAGLSRIDADDPAFGLYHSTDGGGTWANLFTAQYDLSRRREIKLAMSPADPQRISVYYGGYIADAEAHLRVSTDGGATWSDHFLWTVDLGQIGYNSYLFADPRDAATLYLGSRDIFKSTDGGDSWTNMTRNFYDSGQGFTYAPGGSKTHTDQHALAFSPANPDEFYAGNDGGVSKTTDNGATFHSLNASLTLSQFIGISLHPTDPTISYGGTQDNGSQQRLGDSQSWREVVSGDGGHTVIDPLDPSVVFMTYVRGEMYRLTGNAQTFDAQVGWNGAFDEPYDGARMAFYPPFVSNGVDGTLYFGTWRLFISTNLGNSWFAPAGFADLTKGFTSTSTVPDVLSAIGVARSNTSVIYTGSVQGRAMVSTSGGGTWTDITQGLPNRSITSVTVDPSKPAVAYLTVSGFGSGHVFKTTNTGSSWTDISGSLPDIPANCLLFDPVDHNTIYLGTDIGVFRSTASGANWRGFNKGLPPVVVHEFASQPSGLIQVATYGRGAYELVANPPPVIASVSFDGKKRLTITGSSFGDAPRVLINGDDRSDHIIAISDSEVTLKGKAKKIGLRSGDNTVQVVTSDNVASNTFVLRL